MWAKLTLQPSIYRTHPGYRTPALKSLVQQTIHKFYKAEQLYQGD